VVDMKIIHQDCDPTMGEDRSLPNNAFLIEYLQDGLTKFDIVIAAKQVDIFDHYYDNYRNDFKNMTQAQGRVSPKLWGNKPKKESKKK
tara:strand:+ start:3403 stop:3666 length:264 start_codon:yes stop_codon:yes gene_type:complete